MLGFQATDFSVVFGANGLGTNAGSLTITPIGPNVSGAAVTRTFDIYVDIAKATLVVTPDGASPSPKVQVIYDGLLLVEGEDYLFSQDTSVADTRTLTITGKAPNMGSQVVNNAIVRSVSAKGLFSGTGAVQADVALYDTSRTVNISDDNKSGEPYRLVAGTDFTLDYHSSNTAVGTGTVTITGIGDYADKFRYIQEFAIRGNIAAAQLSSISDQAWTGGRIEPAISVSLGGVVLTQGTDYTLNYLSNINAGVASAIITGMGNYEGVIGVQYSIVKPADVNTGGSNTGSDIVVIGTGSTYTGGGVSGYTGGTGSSGSAAFGLGADGTDTDATSALSLASTSNTDKDSGADALKIDGSAVPLANSNGTGLGGLPTWLVFLLGCLTMLIIGGAIYGFVRIKALKQQVKELSWEFDK